MTGSLIDDHPGDFTAVLADLPEIADTLIGLMESEPFGLESADPAVAALFDEPPGPSGPLYVPEGAGNGSRV